MKQGFSQECLGFVECLDQVQSINKQDASPCTERARGKKKLKDKENTAKYLLGGILMAPGAVIGGTAIHELSHAYVIDRYGFEVLDIKVFPYTNEETGYSYMGSTTWNPYNREEGLPTNKENFFINAAPMMTDMGLITLYSTLSLTDRLPKNKWAKTGLLVFMGAYPTVDLINHMSNTAPYTDTGGVIESVSSGLDVSHERAEKITQGTLGAFTAIGALGVGIEAYRILKPAKISKDNERKIKLSPTITSPGIILHGNF